MYWKNIETRKTASIICFSEKKTISLLKCIMVVSKINKIFLRVIGNQFVMWTEWLATFKTWKPGMLKNLENPEKTPLWKTWNQPARAFFGVPFVSNL